ncbi:MAG: tRNA-specific adenosine deaminase [Halothiobacillus sp. 24-54-40]|jgi:tRNA(adenine34) deaminase|nr:nucleoside deaminase [Halothiobacillaceae bacterium]OYY39831.1 MAG: tRNA-specific adenosine deaminase [Halothiobacillus sp. 35-54-62]OYZ87552.1 MAG: tRNA-specific adenosine deaminase [Halothiobacillus sp. 24-54-40]OZA80945.1 MAG: tRNA-specific adenosine deaminase [Halothiobacillus sp. 39-53-45]HQS03207.1 tRNA adenosine(34) deaminase TadA [Halothiobacillus sp.]
MPRTFNRDRYFMQQALLQAQQAGAMGEVPVGAVVVKGAEMIALAGNAPIALHDPTAHAEIRALRAAGVALGNYRLDDCTLYVTLEPCPMCMAAISHARIARVVYAAPDVRAGACGGALDLNRADWHHFKPIIDTGPCEAEAAALLQTFFQTRRD